MYQHYALGQQLRPNPHFYRSTLCSVVIAVGIIMLTIAAAIQTIWWVVMTEGYVENQEFPLNLVETELHNTNYSELCSLHYTGNTRGGIPHGEGVLTILWTSGKESSYRGNFRNGLPYGKGKFFFSDGTPLISDNWEWREDQAPELSSPIYFSDTVSNGIGMYADGKICGLYFGEGIIRQQGEWLNGHLYGFGSICYDARDSVYNNDSLFARLFIDYGVGEYFWQEYDREALQKIISTGTEEIASYRGYIKNGKPYAFAEVDYINGSLFSGVVDEVAAPVYGIYMDPIGGCFMGNFDKNGHPNYGSYLTGSELRDISDAIATGTNYEWTSDCYAWSWDDNAEDDGYTGMRMDGNKEGLGSISEYTNSLFYTNVVLVPTYSGEFHKDEICGYGRMTFADAPQSFVGVFNEGNPCGEGVYDYGVNDEVVSGSSWNYDISDGIEEINGREVFTFYSGMTLDGDRTGQGTLAFFSQNKPQIDEDGVDILRIVYYSGSMRNGYPYGYGQFGFDPETYVSENGNLGTVGNQVIRALWSWTDYMEFGDGAYAGMLANGRPCGYGVLIREDKTVDAGVWLDGELLFREAK